jgi:hypothetical protein
MGANNTVMIHGSPLRLADIEPTIESCRKKPWRQQRWTRRDALVQRGGDMTVPYQGQPYDPKEFELVRGGWKRNMCEICWWELLESENPEHSVGYTDGRRWICSECHYNFFKRT